MKQVGRARGVEDSLQFNRTAGPSSQIYSSILCVPPGSYLAPQQKRKSVPQAHTPSHGGRWNDGDKRIATYEAQTSETTRTKQVDKNITHRLTGAAFFLVTSFFLAWRSGRTSLQTKEAAVAPTREEIKIDTRNGEKGPETAYIYFRKQQHQESQK